MKRYHYLDKMITCQARPADVRLSIRVAATKHTSTFFFSPSLSLPPPTSFSSRLMITTGLMTTPIICYFISLNISPQLLSQPSVQQGELVKYKSKNRAFQKQRVGGGLDALLSLKKEGKMEEKIEKKKRSNCKELSAR